MAAGAANGLESLASLTSFFQSLASGGLTAPPPFPWLWLQPFELNKLAAGGLATGSSPAWALYLLIYIWRRSARAAPLYPAAASRAPGPRPGARPPRPPDPQGGTCCGRPPRPPCPPRGRRPRLPPNPPSAGRRSSSRSSRRRQLARRGSARTGAAAPGDSPAAAAAAATRDVPGRFVSGWQRARRASHAPRPRSLAGSLARSGPRCVGRAAVEAREGDAARDELIAAKYAAEGPERP